MLRYTRSEGISSSLRSSVSPRSALCVRSSCGTLAFVLYITVTLEGRSLVITFFFQGTEQARVSKNSSRLRGFSTIPCRYQCQLCSAAVHKKCHEKTLSQCPGSAKNTKDTIVSPSLHRRDNGLSTLVPQGAIQNRRAAPLQNVQFQEPHLL